MNTYFITSFPSNFEKPKRTVWCGVIMSYTVCFFVEKLGKSNYSLLEKSVISNYSNILFGQDPMSMQGRTTLISLPPWLSWMHLRLVIKRLLVDPCRVSNTLLCKFDHEILSTVISSLPLIQERQLSVFGERMCAILVNMLED